MEMVDKLVELEQLLHIHFNDRSLLERAITHHSCCPESAVQDSYDTLEFLGDALLGAYVVEYIYRTFPTFSEGEMTALKSEVVSRRVLSRLGQELGLFAFIRVDVANLRTFNERSRDSLCTDVLEALIGAIHIDQGAEVSQAFVARTIFPAVMQVHQQELDANPKGRLQNVILRRSGSLPRYRVLEQGGCTNDRVFTVGVFEQNFLLGVGKASSIKEAGRLAASEALEILRAQEIEEPAPPTTLEIQGSEVQKSPEIGAPEVRTSSEAERPAVQHHPEMQGPTRHANLEIEASEVYMSPEIKAPGAFAGPEITQSVEDG